jgi:hypothetical protein
MKAHPFHKPLRTAVALASLGLGVGVHADPVDELKAQIDALTRKVDEIEQRRAVEAPKPPAPRLNLRTSTPTPHGELGTFLEFDLSGAVGTESVSNNLRVRHAYGTLGNLLVGQTWTTFSDPAVYPEPVDFGGPAGVVFARQAQIRWTQPFAGGQ